MYVYAYVRLPCPHSFGIEAYSEGIRDDYRRTLTNISGFANNVYATIHCTYVVIYSGRKGTSGIPTVFRTGQIPNFNLSTAVCTYHVLYNT